MTRTFNIKVALCLSFAGAAWFGVHAVRAADEPPGNEQFKLIVEMIGDADRDMRATGLQVIREQMPGEAATKAFAGLLPKLSPEAQADLLDALGIRGDAAARPAALDMLKSPREAVRAAALRVLGPLGGTADVAVLSQKAAAGEPLEQVAARQSLTRLRGDGVDAALAAALAKGEPNVREVLLGVLADRNAKEALPNAMKYAEDPEPAVRMAALAALRILAGENETPAIVKMVKAAKDDAERYKTELTLLAVCTRGRQKCADAIIAGLADADAASAVVLLDGLARAGGPKALPTIVAHLQDKDESVRDGAMRLLSAWPDADVAPYLLAVAKDGKNLLQQVLAIRGLVRLASPQKDKPADLPMLADAMKLAKRPQEKRLVLGVLGVVATPQSLAMVVAALDDPALAEDAGLAAVLIAENIQDENKEQTRTAMQKVLQQVKNPKTRDRVNKILESL